MAQKKYKFLFGAASGYRFLSLVNGRLHGQDKDVARQIAEKILNLCNAVTLPFYWG